LESTDPIADSTLDRLDLLKEFLPALASIGPYVDDLESFEFVPVMDKIVEGIKKVFDLSTNPNFDKNVLVVERVSSLVSSISGLTDMLSYYIKKTEYFGEEVENVDNEISPITDMFNDLATAYNAFCAAFYFGDDQRDLWNESLHSPILERIKSISEIIQMITPYIGLQAKIGSVTSAFINIASAYGEFIKAINDETIVPALSSGNEETFERAKTLAEIISMLANANGEGSVDLKISPIMDMDEIQRQLNEGGSVVLNNGLRLSSEFTITAKLDTEQLSQLSPIDYSANFADVSEKLGLMNDKLNEVYERMDQFDVILNTGALVGELAPRIDRYIGRTTFELGRWKSK
jgi:hypothetical protein